MLDTGPIVALLNNGDPAHERSVAMVEELDEDLVVPALVFVEVDYWVRKLLADVAWSTFVEDVAAGSYRIEPFGAGDFVRAAELQAQYRELGLGLVDASVIVACERLVETKVGTLDRRDFGVVRPRHCEYLRLLPD